MGVPVVSTSTRMDLGDARRPQVIMEAYLSAMLVNLQIARIWQIVQLIQGNNFQHRLVLEVGKWYKMTDKYFYITDHLWILCEVIQFFLWVHVDNYTLLIHTQQLNKFQNANPVRLSAKMDTAVLQKEQNVMVMPTVLIKLTKTIAVSHTKDA